MANKTVLRIVIVGLVAGGLCGAVVGTGLAPPVVGVGGAIAIGATVAVLVARAKQRSRGGGDA